MSNAIAHWMASKPSPPIEDTGVFGGEWATSAPGPPRPPTVVSDWLRSPVRWNENDPMGSMLKACRDVADFETLLRLV